MAKNKKDQLNRKEWGIWRKNRKKLALVKQPTQRESLLTEQNWFHQLNAEH
jgi:hypothetical protein